MSIKELSSKLAVKNHHEPAVKKRLGKKKGLEERGKKKRRRRGLEELKVKFI
jgi:hypothetical protein